MLLIFFSIFFYRVPKVESKGLIRCKEVESARLTVASMTTDQHLSIAKYIREQWPVAHYFDTWHVAKGSRLKSKIPIHHAGLCHLGTTN